MDVHGMSIPSSSIDIALDKGTLDAMLHGSLWDPDDDVKENVGAYVDEVARVAKPGGRFLYISYRQPRFLKPLLSRPDLWHVQVETLADDPGSFESALEPNPKALEVDGPAKIAQLTPNCLSVPMFRRI